MSKEKKKSPYYATVTANCYTQEEAILMINLVVTCQHHYRELKKQHRPHTLIKVLSASRHDLTRADKLQFSKTNIEKHPRPRTIQSGLKPSRPRLKRRT